VRKGLIWLLVAVAGAHGLALAWWWQRPTRVSGEGAWHASSAFRVRATVLQEVSRPPQRGWGGEAAHATPRPDSAPVRPPIDQGVPPLSREPGADAQPVPNVSEPSLPRAGERTLWLPSPAEYLSDEQVDTLPYPQDDWQLAWSQLPPTGGAWRVTLRLWVSPQGHIDHVEVLEIEPNLAWLSALFERVHQTAMVPATLAGQAVPVTYVVQLAPDQLQ